MNDFVVLEGMIELETFPGLYYRGNPMGGVIRRYEGEIVVSSVGITIEKSNDYKGQSIVSFRFGQWDLCQCRIPGTPREVAKKIGLIE